MEFRVLCPTEVRRGAQPVDTGRPQQRCVLAAIAVDAGRPVRIETLIERVWGEHPPVRAKHALYVYIARLRSALRQAGTGDDAPAELVRRSGGYLLDVPRDQVDLHRFRDLVVRARQPDCADRRRADLLGEALRLWRGVPLADLPGEWAAQVREGLRREQVEAAVAWAQVELRLANATAVIGPLSDLIAAAPLAEPLVAALMRPLASTGRGAEALDCYATTSKRLAEHLGVDPSGELRALHQAILRGELPADGPPADGPPPAPPAPPVPAQLPPDVAGFTARHPELDYLDALLETASPDAASPTCGQPGYEGSEG
jgi:DNA-binding SARP family transcriptional activator